MIRINHRFARRLRTRRNSATYRHRTIGRALRAERLEDRLLLTGTHDGGLTTDFGDYADDSLIVRFRENITPDQFKMGPNITSLPFSVEVGDQYKMLPGLRKLNLPAHVSVESALELLQGNDAILYAEPNYRVHLSSIPDDPLFGEMWGLENEGQTGGTYDADIDALEAWDETVGSGNAIVAVIDTGVNYLHDDLAANMWVNTGEIPGDHQDNDGNGFVDDVHGYDFVNNDGDPNDDQGHGTHVAGTIAAVGNNGIGVTGINWNAKIMALKFLDASGNGSTDDAIKAIDYAVANGAKLSNNSWGYNGDFSQSLYEAVEAAQNADHIFVAAAGNGNIFGFGLNNDTNPFWPANFDLGNVISVAAVDSNDSKPLFSNYGATTVDLAAPGVDILSTVRTGGYGYNTGTSMASPHVAGVVALVQDQHPDWGYAQVVNQVLQSVDPISSMEGITVTGGRLNAARAVGVEIVPAPEIQVLSGSQNIVDGEGVVDYGNTPPGLAQDLTFTIKNRGVLPLTLSEPISVPNGYSLVESFAATTVDVGETTAFTIRLDGDVEGTYTGQVSFANDDPDENPFDFTVTGTVAIPPAVAIVDDGDPTFAVSGEWDQWTGQGYEDDVHESLPGTGQDEAVWSFDRLLPGKYRVAATWSEYSNRATNSPFTILDDTIALGTVEVNQQLAPIGFSDQGAQWQTLPGVFTISGHVLRVKLTDDADGRVNADAIRIERVDPEPEIEVRYGGANIEDGVTVVDLGVTTIGTPLLQSFTVRNLGADDLVLEDTIELPPGYSLDSGLSATTLGTDETATFTVSLDAEAAGTYSGDILLHNNDADESPFNLTVVGEVESPPPVSIVDNGDSAFTAVGGWTHWTGQGYENDIHESLAGSGADVASWSFTNLLPGNYQVSATWTSFTNRATNAPFSILVGGATVGSAVVNQQLAPDDFADAGVTWERLGGVINVDSGELVVRVTDAADGRINADAIRLERLADAPEVAVSADGLDLADGATFDFGNTPPGITVTQVFTVENAGTQTLLLQEPIDVSVGFSLVSSFGTTVLLPGETTTFAIQFDGIADGVATGAVTFGTNDADENPFDLNLSGNVTIPPAVQILDNGDAGFITVGEWRRWTGQGYENDIHESLPGSGTDVATWTFSGLIPGSYRVAATWSSFTNRASNAPFTILDDTAPLTTVYVNQRLAPAGFTADGAQWQYLGTVHELTSNTLIVKLSDLADGRLNADAIRIERLAAAPEIQVTQSGTNIVDGISSVNLGSTSLDSPITTTFTVTNRGGETLHLSEPIEVPAGFTVVSGFGQLELATDQSTTFTLQLDATDAGTVSGQVSFANDDADENPFDFQVEGTVLGPPPVVIVDNGDTGFSAIGEWRRWTQQGYLGDIHESLSGTGADIASWTFTNLQPGEYRISATWTAFSNRASDSPFTILDGSTNLGTISVDQRWAPSEFVDSGVYWDDLGSTVQIDSGTLVVQLSDAADGRVNADAIRVERIEGGISGASLGDGRGEDSPVLDGIVAQQLADRPGFPAPFERQAQEAWASAVAPVASGWVESDSTRAASQQGQSATRDRLFDRWPTRRLQLDELLGELTDGDDANGQL